MNKVLSLLLAFVFLQTQAWALTGGPNYNSGSATGNISLLGVYAGALLPSGDESSDEIAAEDLATNGLGLFALSVPETGLGTGQFVYFSEGRTFTGTITGVADPDKGTLTGLLKGQFDIVTDNVQVNDDFLGDASLVASQPGGFANGQVTADFVPSEFVGVTAAGVPFTGLRIEGTATIEISEFRETTSREPGVDDGDPATDDRITVTTTSVVPVGTVNLSVDGFRQSTTPGSVTVTLGGTAQ
ncbi:MAG: hypothetical protein EOP84_19375 [Verrucomicrobiaceae bacterium]|nr:MAG: hypothetical protein EOP84_19375 [Verrucomicrobiaceae bacterium]